MLKLIAKYYRRNARAKRAKIFLSAFDLNHRVNILDLGGGDGSYIHSILKDHPQCNIYIADILTDDLRKAKTEYGYETIELNESGKLDFEDQYFDIVFCNSVIEHVTVDKKDIYQKISKSQFENAAYQRQEKFAEEIRRVGKQYYVQTPNKFFIIESHSWFLNVYPFLSRSSQIKLLNFLGKFWPKSTTPDWNLLTSKKMKLFFPESEIVNEKSLGMTKSLIAIKSFKK